MKRNELAEIFAPTVALFAQIMLAIAKAIEEVIAGIINAGMGV